VKVGDEDDPVRHQVRLDASKSNWSAFREVTQRVRMQKGYQEWKAAWLARHGIPDKREQVLQPPPGSPEAVTFWRNIAKQDQQNLIRMMRDVGATEDEITAEEWRPFYHELSRPGGSFEQILAAAGAARVARAAVKGSGLRSLGPTIEPPPRPRVVVTAPPDPPRRAASRSKTGPVVGEVAVPRGIVSETKGAVTNLGTRTTAENSELFAKLQPGEGMSGVYDHSTGKFVLRHSTDAKPIPEGSVAQYGGHSNVRIDLGNALGEDLSNAVSGRLSGFSLQKQSDGSIKFGWNSGQINPGSHGNRAVPDSLRPGIESDVKAALGL